MNVIILFWADFGTNPSKCYFKNDLVVLMVNIETTILMKFTSTWGTNLSYCLSNTKISYTKILSNIKHKLSLSNCIVNELIYLRKIFFTHISQCSTGRIVKCLLSCPIYTQSTQSWKYGIFKSCPIMYISCSK